MFTAWSDEPWVNEGAAVRVSLVCFGNGPGSVLDGKPVPQIAADLSAATHGGDGLTQAVPLLENKGCAFQGPTKGGPFDISGNEARRMLA